MFDTVVMETSWSWCLAPAQRANVLPWQQHKLWQLFVSTEINITKIKGTKIKDYPMLLLKDLIDCGSGYY